MEDLYFCSPSITMDTNDSFIYIGWAPEVVRIMNLTDGQDNYWCRMLSNDGSISRVAAGDRTVNTGAGVKLVQFDYNEPLLQTSDPTVIAEDEWYKANGIQLTSDIAFLGDDDVIMVEAWRPSGRRVIRAVHDGTTSSNTYMEDRSIDFLKSGVQAGDVVYNQTNGDYAYVGEVQRPSGQKKYCRLTLVTSQGGNATTAADIDTSDVLYVYPPQRFPYPVGDIGLMT